MPPILGEAKEGNKRAAPAFSITGRGKDSESKTPMPGPGTYTTDKAVGVLSKRPPAYTMAPRRELRHPSEAIPGPGVYCPEKVPYFFSINHEPFLCAKNSKHDIIDEIIHERSVNAMIALKTLGVKLCLYSFYVNQVYFIRQTIYNMPRTTGWECLQLFEVPSYIM